jgi:hypothetical protein
MAVGYLERVIIGDCYELLIVSEQIFEYVVSYPSGHYVGPVRKEKSQDGALS